PRYPGTRYTYLHTSYLDKIRRCLTGNPSSICPEKWHLFVSCLSCAASLPIRPCRSAVDPVHVPRYVPFCTAERTTFCLLC
ncbi:hypothetical protein LY76DRAFT_524376, partial [Colletotrichum caudatum]